MATNPPTHPCHICGGKLEWEVVPQHREPWEAPRFGPTDWRQLPHECPPRAVEAWVERVFDKSPRQPFFKEIEVVSERKEVMWCTVCGGRFTEDEVKGWGCPKCGNQGVPCGCDQDVKVEVNWHELRILTIWAEHWARQCKEKADDKNSDAMPLVVQAIARRLQGQHPAFTQLTLSGEIAALPADLAKAGIEIGGPVESTIPKPDLFPVYGPGAVGHTP